MIDPSNRRLSISRQAELLGVSRSHHYYKRRPQRRDDIEEKIKLKEMFLKYPFYGYRKQVHELKESAGIISTPKRVRRLMHEMGLKALSPRQMTSVPKKEHPIYPYLLKGKRIRYPNQVWATDITYLKLDVGYVYLVAILDIYSRKVLSWRISLSMDADFCIEALKDAMATYGVPAIFNTDQGSQFTSYGFIRVLKDAGVEISMDGQGRWRDNIYVERFWRTLKYEDIYLRSYETVRDLKLGLSRYFRFYNSRRFHQSLDYRTPDEMYESFRVEGERAAA
jgi:putative transposase